MYTITHNGPTFTLAAPDRRSVTFSADPAGWGMLAEAQETPVGIYRDGGAVVYHGDDRYTITTGWASLPLARHQVRFIHGWLLSTYHKAMEV